MATDAYEEIRIGPFVGGLNTLSDQTSIGDTELFVMNNFECDKDGSLVSRPPIFRVTGAAIPNSLKILGYYVNSAGAYYVIGNGRNGGTYYFASGAWTTLTSSFAATACVQYRDKLYLVAPLSSANPGGTWDPVGGFVADATMPKGAAIVTSRDHLWIAQGAGATTNGSRIYVSDVSAGALVWDGDFINVSQGDGQNVVDLAAVNTDLIIFKDRSTYRFSYASDIAQGVVSKLSDTIGASATGCYTSWDNQLYLLFDGSLYEFSNYNFTRLNPTVPFVANNPSVALTEYFGLSAWSNRVFVSFYDRLFVYNLLNQTWCEWSSPSRVGTFGRFFPLPVNQGISPSAYLYSTQPAGSLTSRFMHVIYDNFNSTGTDEYGSENFDCTFETKNYDYSTPSKFKRLRFWGADILSRTNINVQAKPVNYGQSVTWDDLKNGPNPDLSTSILNTPIQNICANPAGYSSRTEGWVEQNTTDTTIVTAAMTSASGNGIRVVFNGNITVARSEGARYTAAVIPGETYSMSVGRMAWDPHAGPASQTWSCVAVFYDGSGTSLGQFEGPIWSFSGPGTAPNPSGLHLDGAVAPAGSKWAYFYIRIPNANGVVSSAQFTFSDVAITTSNTNVPYFDGNSADVAGVVDYLWQGTAGYSPSFKFNYSASPGYSWDDIKTTGGTWDRPIDISYIVSDNVSVAGLTGGRKWVKFLKSLRFRQIAFRATTTVDGTQATMPARVFNLTTYIREKELVPRKIN